MTSYDFALLSLFVLVGCGGSGTDTQTGSGGSAGQSSGGSGGAATGGSANTGGAASGGSSGSIGSGGSSSGGSSSGSCGGQTCSANQFCCGPAECGFCAFNGTGPFCGFECSSGGAGGSSSDVHCGTDPEVFPTFERACVTKDSCAIVSRQTDCCGNFKLTGVDASEAERYQAASQTCSGQYPICECPLGPIATDSGQEAESPASVAVECQSGVCTTLVP